MTAFASGTYDEWCRWLFDSLRDGGEWIVPRSGLIFRKAEQPREFVLVDGDDADDFESIREHFEHAGISVRKGER